MSSAVVVFTRDLRLHDHPALRAATAATAAVPLFVFDDAILSGRFNRPNRTQYLLQSLTDLDGSLRARGGRLVVRRGGWVAEVLGAAREAGAATVHVSDDVTPFARRRLAALEAAGAGVGVGVVRHPGTTVVPPDALRSSGGGHFQVFTPYHRRWLEAARRPVLAPPDAVRVPDVVADAPLPRLADLVAGAPSPEVVAGGESAARAALDAWVKARLAEYGDRHDDLPGDATSRVSAALRFGCVSPAELEQELTGRPGAEPFVRQLCWRDFYAQALLARPDAAWGDYRRRGDAWHDDPERFAAWAEGRTGYPVVDAAMRQLRREGFVHNRARMVAASFLTKDLYLDWRLGAREFLDWLVDGEIANNNLNWQWTAGTGADTNPHRIFNPTVQARRFDPDGDYVRRYVPELRAVPGKAVHEPWKLPAAVREALDYPPPIVDHHEAIAEYKDRSRLSGQRQARSTTHRALS